MICGFNGGQNVPISQGNYSFFRRHQDMGGEKLISPYLAVSFPSGTPQSKIIEAMAIGTASTAMLHQFNSPVLRDQFVSRLPTLHYAVSQKQAEKMRLL